MRGRRFFSAGFTAAEMLVATMIGGMVVGAAALCFGALSRGQRQYTNVTTVNLPAGAQNNFYGVNSNTITTYMAPNYGSVARAESMRERFYLDTSQAIAVYCLSRLASFNTVRPTTLPSPAFGTAMDTPDAFRTYLATAIPASATLFSSYRNCPTSPNVSIFILGYSTEAATIPVIAVYDIDLVQATDPNDTNTVVGTYASVRRYAAGSLTAYYDVVYPASGQTESWVPPVVAFERKSRKAFTESVGIEAFKVAAGRPFYFVFWPDPAEDSLAVPLDSMPSGTLNGSYATSDPRRAYNHMAGRTSFMMTVPMFPSF